MSIRQPREAGFAAIEAVLIVVVLVIAAGTGFFIYHANKNTSTTLANAAQDAKASPAPVRKATSKATTTTHSASTGSAQPAGLTGSGAKELVQSVYQKYLAAVANSNDSNNVIDARLAVKPYLTDEAYSKLTSGSNEYDHMICAQEVPTSVAVTLEDSSNDSAAVSVVEAYTGSQVKVLTTVDLHAGKIDSITCPSMN